MAPKTSAELAMQRRFAELAKKKEQQRLAQQQQNGAGGSSAVQSSGVPTGATVDPVKRAQELLRAQQGAGRKPAARSNQLTAPAAPRPPAEQPVDPIEQAKRLMAQKRQNSEAAARKRPAARRPSAQRPAAAVPPFPQADAGVGGSQSPDAARPDSPPNHQPAASNKRAREAEPEEAGPSGEAHESQETSVFVGSLPPYFEEAALLELFQPFGAILDVRIPAGQSYGFVTFERSHDAVTALRHVQQSPIIVQGHTLRAKPALSPAERARQSHKSGRMEVFEHPKVKEAREVGAAIAHTSSPAEQNWVPAPSRNLVCYEDL